MVVTGLMQVRVAVLGSLVGSPSKMTAAIRSAVTSSSRSEASARRTTSAPWLNPMSTNRACGERSDSCETSSTERAAPRLRLLGYNHGLAGYSTAMRLSSASGRRNRSSSSNLSRTPATVAPMPTWAGSQRSKVPRTPTAMTSGRVAPTRSFLNANQGAGKPDP